MQTKLADFIRDTPDGIEADSILRSCVHCGFCTATCPTYQLLGDELDGPRGRIYLIKQVLEGTPATVTTQRHLDRCLTCRSCETTCPSGVKYGRLIDIGRAVVERQVVRPLAQRLVHTALRETVARRWLFTPLLKTGQSVRALLPASLRAKVPARQTIVATTTPRHPRTMLVLDGCVQPAMAPSINAAATRVLDALGVSLVAAPKAGCCGAVRHHLNAQEQALDDVRRNIDAWWPYIEQGAELIVMTSSGCGVMVKDYGHLLAHDGAYAARAKQVAALTRDLSEVLEAFSAQLARRLAGSTGEPVAFHPPCTLQHGQQIRGKVENLLQLAGVKATLCRDSHLCCGSAGTYSVLQPAIASQLRANKLASLRATGATSVVSANIGCQAHLQDANDMPVRHWIEVIDDALARVPRGADGAA